MKAKAKEFTAALNRVLPVLRTRTTLPILTCLRLEAKEGRLTTVASDIDAFASASCPCEGDLPPVCVDAAMLSHLAQQATEGFELVAVDEKRLRVKGAGTASLSILPAAEFPAWPDTGTKQLAISALDLADCIGTVAWATDTNPKISLDVWKECVWVHGATDALECCGTNGKEFAHVKRPLKGSTCEFMFPSKQARLLQDSLETATEVRLSENFISTVSDSFQVAIRLAAGKYIPINFLLEQQQQPLGMMGNLEMEPILQALHTIKALGHGEIYLEGRMEFEPEQITLLFRSERANFEQSIPRKFEGQPKAIRFDVLRAIRVFSHVQEQTKVALGDVSILFADGENTFALGLLHG